MAVSRALRGLVVMLLGVKAGGREILLLALLALGWNSMAFAAPKVLEFSDKASVGALYKESGPLENPDLVYLGAARGRVVLPEGTRLGLVGNYVLANDMNCLLKLPASSLSSFCMKRVDTADDRPVDLKPLAHLTGLKRLKITECNLCDEDLAPLESLKQIRLLEFWYCSIHGSTFDRLVGLKQMKDFGVSLNRLCPQAYRAIGRMSQLEVLRIGQTSATDADLAEIGKLTRLRNLNIGENPALTVKGLSYLRACRELHHLNVAHCKFSTQDILVLKGLPLKVLYISSRHIPRAEWPRLTRAFPGVDIVDCDVVDPRTKFLFSPLH